MFRCYLLHNGRIAQRNDLDAETLEHAIAEGRRLLAIRTPIGPFGGMEIWCDASLIYSDRCHAADTGSSAIIDSPFATPESTILPNWRPTIGCPIMAAESASARDTTPAEGADKLRFALLRKLIRRKPVCRLIAA